MALTDADRLRQILGESIPPGGSEGDTLFTTAQIDDLLARSGSPVNLDKAAYYGWEVKLGTLSNLVDVKEGNSSRSMSDLSKNAKEMLEFYGLKTGIISDPDGAPTRNVRVARIRRSGGSIA